MRGNSVRTIVSVLCASALVLAALPAFAGNDLAGQGASRPWAQGVSPEDQKVALELFRDGNALLKNSVFVAAAAKYREALKHWDHPAIHYNLVLALLNLDQPVEVHDHLKEAMKYGPAPLDQDKFEQARAFNNLIEKQLARVSISCEEPGARVLMDGQPLFTAPGKYEAWVRAGPHSIVATKEGFLPNQLSKSLPSGEVSQFNLKLYSEDDLTQYRRRWSTWVPWSVVGAGVVVGGAGALLHMQAANDFKNFDQGVTQCGGCFPPSSLAGKKSQGDTFQSIAIGSYVAGGAILATGAVLLYMNRLQPYRIDTSTDVDPSASSKPEVTVLPYVAPNQGGLTALARF